MTLAAAKERLRQIVREDDAPSGRAFDWAIQVLIIISVVSFSVETLPDLSPETRRWLFIVELCCVVVFTLEYALRFWLAESKRAFVFSFYGLIDLASILPFYVARGVDLRAIRAFRLLRLLRLLKLVRYSQAVERFRRAFGDVRAELSLFLAMCALMVYLSSVGIYYFESKAQPETFGSVFSSMWWAIATLSTVGYGDVYPITAGGKVFTALLLAVGLGVVAIPSGLVASSLTEVFREEHEAEDTAREAGLQS